MAAGKRLQGIVRIASRLRPRYSIRQLLILTAAIGAAIAWWMHGATYTGREFDVAIIGDGYFMVQDLEPASPTNTGEIFYTRDGHLALDSYRQLCVSHGRKLWTLSPPICLIDGGAGITIESDGKVFGHFGASGGIQQSQLGSLQLSAFPPGSASPIPGYGGILCMTSNFDKQHGGNPAHFGMGWLRQGFIGTGWETFIPPLIAVGIAAVVYGLFKWRWSRNPKCSSPPAIG
jgi:hypothetical protein